MTERLDQMIARHEGFRATVYCDRCGHALEPQGGGNGRWWCKAGCQGGDLTVGYGQRVDGDGITEQQALALLDERIQAILDELAVTDWYLKLDIRRRNAITDMAYTMGVAGVLEFKGMIAALEAQDWERARNEVLLSKWHTQAPMRAAEIARILEAGVMPSVQLSGRPS